MYKILLILDKMKTSTWDSLKNPVWLPVSPEFHMLNYAFSHLNGYFGYQNQSGGDQQSVLCQDFWIQNYWECILACCSNWLTYIIQSEREMLADKTYLLMMKMLVKSVPVETDYMKPTGGGFILTKRDKLPAFLSSLWESFCD